MPATLNSPDRQQPLQLATDFLGEDKGDLAIVGQTYAVADLRLAKFAGFPAWVLWAVVHIYFLIGFANRLFVLLQWGLAFLTKRRRVRVLSEEPPSAQNLIDPAA
jgi:NADH dehydrogenase